MIVAIAIRFAGQVYSMPKPAKHLHLMLEWIDKLPDIDTGIKGFLDDKGNFLTRAEAGIHALTCGQVAGLPTFRQFQSDDLW